MPSKWFWIKCFREDFTSFGHTTPRRVYASHCFPGIFSAFTENTKKNVSKAILWVRQNRLSSVVQLNYFKSIFTEQINIGKRCARVIKWSLKWRGPSSLDICRFWCLLTFNPPESNSVILFLLIILSSFHSVILSSCHRSLDPPISHWTAAAWLSDKSN